MEQVNLKLDLETARRLYEDSSTSEEMKVILEQSIGKDKLSRLPLSWEALGEISGWYVNGTNCGVVETSDVNTTNDNRDVFPYKGQAKASIAMAQLAQLKKAYNGTWTPDWSLNTSKWCIAYCETRFKVYPSTDYKRFLVFEEETKAKHFLENHKELIERALTLL